MPVIAGLGPDGALVPIRATVAGLLEVDASEEGAGADVPALLTRLAWEVRELRRVACEATDQLFKEYPG